MTPDHSVDNKTFSSTSPPLASTRSFLAMLAHDLRNHIAPIQNAMHLLRLRARSDPAVLPLVQIIERQLTAMVRTLDLVVEADRVNRGEGQLNLESVTIGALVRDAIESLRPLLDRRPHGITVDVPSDLPAIEADAARIERVLKVLLDNAARYSPEDGKLAVRADVRDDVLEVCIEDEGPGLAPEVEGRVWEFFATPRNSRQGLGVGLPLARMIARLHGGDVRIGRTPSGTATVATLRLPCRVKTAPGALRVHDTGPGPTAGGEAGPSASDRRDPLRILIADDNAAVRASLTDLLQEMGHEVRAAVDGAEAVAVASEWRPEFVLLDIHMPKLNGFQAARQLRAAFPRAAMQLVMMSGEALDDLMRRGAHDAGFDHCVDKGLAIGELAGLLSTNSTDGLPRASGP